MLNRRGEAVPRAQRSAPRTRRSGGGHQSAFGLNASMRCAPRGRTRAIGPAIRRESSIRSRAYGWDSKCGRRGVRFKRTDLCELTHSLRCEWKQMCQSNGAVPRHDAAKITGLVTGAAVYGVQAAAHRVGIRRR
jgi:hypothetical protein